MFILDTDTITHDQKAHPLVTAKVRKTPPEQLFTTSITVEEQLRGRLAYLSKHRNDPRKSAVGHLDLVETIKSLSRWSILLFEAEAEIIFRDLKRQHPRLGTQDLRIAAIALKHGFIVVTCNTRDFARVPRLRIEDWAASA